MRERIHALAIPIWQVLKEVIALNLNASRNPHAVHFIINTVNPACLVKTDGGGTRLQREFIHFRGFILRNKYIHQRES